LYPPSSNHFLDLGQLAHPHIRAILARIESVAAQEGLAVMRLETGIHQAEALALYRAAGYVDCAPFGEYRADPLSRFLEKRLPQV